MPVIIAPLVVMVSLFQVLVDLLRKPKYRAVLIWMALILLMGTVFYHRIEGWSWVDSFYFSVVTLATVGYGDFAPTTDGSKLFTVAYIFIGFSVFITFAGMLTQERADLRHIRQSRKNNDGKSEEHDLLDGFKN